MKKSIQTEGAINLIDQAEDCRENIIAIAALLRGCEKADTLDGKIIANAGRLILGETEKLDDLLNRLEEKL